MSVHQLVTELSYEEFLGWMAYFELRPFQWREDDRASKLMQAWGVKEKPWRIFPSLDAVYNRRPRNDDGTDISSLKGSLFLQKMSEAKGGEVLPI
jgi:hypothetical protein